MAYTFDVGGTIPATGAETIFRLKAALKTAGWTVTMSSDGTTYNATGDQITTATTGAGGMNNARAWFVIQSPGTPTRQLSFQRQSTTGANSAHLWRVKYSATAGFTGGSPAATVVSSATDEKVLSGGGTDASPTFTQILSTTDGSYRMNVAAGGSSELYGFYLITNTTGAATLTYGIYVDPMETATYPALDVDPCVVCVAGSANQVFSSTVINVTTQTTIIQGYAYSWLKRGLSGEAFVNVGFSNYATDSSAVVFPLAGGQNAHTGYDDLLPLVWMRPAVRTAPTGYKGVSKQFKLVSTSRANGDTLSVVTSKDYLLASSNAAPSFALPWNGTDFVI
jgi:hypothetical protein